MPASADPRGPASLSLDQLSKTAISLNKASDRLNQAINQLNEALKKLNLGISSWVSFYVYDEGPFSDVHQIGYAKVNGKWGIGIKKTFEDLNRPDEDQVEVTEWQFCEAPREMRIAAIPYLSQVIEQLNKDAEKTTDLINEKTTTAEQLTAAIEAILDPPRRSVATKHEGGR
jgi:methyl-accepting chemotaxis protein